MGTAKKDSVVIKVMIAVLVASLIMGPLCSLSTFATKQSEITPASLLTEKERITPKSVRTVDDFLRTITSAYSKTLIADKAIIDGSTTSAIAITLDGTFGPVQRVNLLLAYEKAKNLYPEYLAAYPELIWSVKNKADGKAYVLSLQFKGAPMAVKYQQDFFKKTRLDVQEIIRTNRLDTESSTRESLEAIAAYIADTVTYDEANPEGYHGYGAAVEGSASCQGYTARFNLMARMMGIEVMGIAGYGNGGAHIWSKVKVDGQWVHVDMTWADANGKSKDGKEFDPNNRYFAMGSDDARKDHEWFRDVYGE